MTMKFKHAKLKSNPSTFGQLGVGAVFRRTQFGDIFMKVNPNSFKSGPDFPANTLNFTDHALYYTYDDGEVFPTTLIVEEEV